MALTLSIGITENSYSVANNTSSVTVSVNVSWTGGSWDHNGYTKYLTINGTRYNFDSVKVNPNRTTTGSQTLYSTTVTIGHDSNGKGSVSCYASVKTATGSGTVTASNSLTLTTIPRKTDISLSASSVYFGSNITINCAKKSSSFTNKLYYKINSGSWNVMNANAGNSHVFNVALSLIANIPNDMSCTITVECDTYNGSTLIGSSSAKFTANVPSSARTAPKLSKTEMFLRDEGVSITLEPYAGTWQHIIAYSMGNTSGYIAESMTTNKSFTFTPPIELAQQIPNAESGNLSITVYTYNGSGTLVGSTSATIKVKVPTDIKPVVSGINVSEAVSVVTDNFEGFVQNLSQLLVDISASGAQGSTIASHKTTVEGISYLGRQFTSGVVKTTGQVQIATTVTDSRGRTASGNTAISVIPYVEPSLDISARADGTKVLVELVGSVSSVNEQNTKELTLKYKKTSDAHYSAPETIPLSDWQFDIPKEINVDASETTYEFVAVLTDKIKSNEKSTMTGIVVMSRRAGGKGVTFSGEATQDGFVVGWNSYFYKPVTIERDSNPWIALKIGDKIAYFQMAYDKIGIGYNWDKSVKIDLNGNLTGKYLTGTWLQTTAVTDLGSKPPKVAVLDGNGWVYSRTLEELIYDLTNKKWGCACSARGSADSLSLSAGTVKALTLNTWDLRNDTGFTFSGGGIKCPYDGTVRISGSVYISSQANNTVGCYIKKGTTEILSTLTSSSTAGGVSAGTKVIDVAAGDVIYICARSFVANTCIPKNHATHLDIEYIK